jgi:uncharacterized protein YdiU (UPF0061 family)
MRTLQDLKFDNSFVRELPEDPENGPRQRQVLGACFSKAAPTKVSRPQLVAWAAEVAELLDLSTSFSARQEWAEVFAGNRLTAGMDPYAACYGGHQFGTWAGQLGDGRAITLGEVLNRSGQRWELQLKGAGLTPFSRMGDGRAVMRSSVREFLCSEAMHHLGVPTTRALSLVDTGDPIVRDMFYDGNPRPEPGAIVCRVAPSFLRFGNFEIFTAQKNHDVLKTLANYTITTHFPHLGVPSQEVILEWFREVCRRTAVMIVHWMRVGFVHGVMNTDNMSVLGLTIDYGPYGWLDNYDPNWTPNTTDAGGRRYRYGYQPQIAQWNLARFAEALLPLVDSVEPLENALQTYSKTFEQEQRAMMAQKLGLAERRGDGASEDAAMVDELLAAMQLVETDMTIFYRKLADVQIHTETKFATNAELLAPLREAWYAPEELTAEPTEKLTAWLRRYIARAREENTPDAMRRAKMNKVNPKYVLRNYVAQLAIDKAEEGDGSVVEELLEVMRHPYDEQPSKEQYAQKRPEWARHRPGCSMLSCSS